MIISFHLFYLIKNNQDLLNYMLNSDENYNNPFYTEDELSKEYLLSFKKECKKELTKLAKQLEIYNIKKDIEDCMINNKKGETNGIRKI